MDINKTAKETASECEDLIKVAIANAYKTGVEDACAGIADAIDRLSLKTDEGSPQETAFLQAMKIAEEWTP